VAPSRAEPEAYDAAPNRADPEAYVAPDDPNTGARTEPFRGPFEPPPGQPKLSEFVPSSSSPAEPAEPAEPAVPDGPGGRDELGQPGTSGPATALSPAGPAGETDASTEPHPTLAPAPPGASAEKLEKIKDLYLTVEAIGDDNVGKHFDELMTRQRELISDYFRETGIGKGRPQATQTDQPS
jgi:hypothetical protein